MFQANEEVPAIGKPVKTARHGELRFCRCWLWIFFEDDSKASGKDGEGVTKNIAFLNLGYIFVHEAKLTKLSKKIGFKFLGFIKKKT